ncbi:GDSL-type esterase/lipase family protein [Halobacillus litoralis]|uniref:GDSL-type esterase/lipase family protein n=1 Tax=Halobacillus litoralis TaxID=45668 RepID=UPI001CD677AF|nr:GDSL-type esterase/lipase family protein [Halobacillus litoralis]MCA0971254.1 GDSL-type esterase/lipase family protein [Halobacillus litoralis]
MRNILLLAIIFMIIQPMLVQAEEKKLVAIGDSIPYGYHLPDPEQQSFPALISKDKGWHLTNLSKPGITSEELLAKLNNDPQVIHSVQEADYIILYIGGNDLLNLLKENKDLDQLDVGEVKGVITDLLDHVGRILIELNKKSDAKVLVYNLYNPYPKAGPEVDVPLRYINEQYKTLSQFYQYVMDVQVVDAYSVFHKRPEYMMTRDVHPTIIGHRALADLGLRALP